MNFNTILIMFGLDPEQFNDFPVNPIKSGNDLIYEITQKCDSAECPYCCSHNLYVKDHDIVTINATINGRFKEIIKIKKC